MVFREGYKYVCENKNYRLDFLSQLAYELIFLGGILHVLRASGGLTAASLAYVLAWYLVQGVVGEMVYSLEYEIRSLGLVNLLASGASLAQIYFRRSLVWLAKSLLVFGLAALFFWRDLDLAWGLKGNLFLGLGLALAFLYGLYYLFMALALIFERVATFTNLAMTVLLVLGMRLPLVAKIHRLLEGQQVAYGGVLVEGVLLALLAYGLYQEAGRRLARRGF